jgi:phosphoribosylglycinamide formyltransferase 1
MASATAKRLGILLSGRGSNFVAIADAIAAGRLDAEIAVVISNQPDVPGLKIAQERRIKAVHLPHNGLSREQYDQKIALELEKHWVDLICLAGYMRLLSPEFVRRYPQKILNIHPSLLPAFPGLNSQKAALQWGVRYAGCTVHFVDEGLDSGPIIRQAPVEVRNDDTEQTLSARILKEEHRIYSQAIALVLSGQYDIVGRRVRDLR